VTGQAREQGQETKENNLSPSTFDLLPTVDPKYEKVETLLETYDLNNITPLQALQLLSKIKDELK
jgi:hypothetical protein